MNKPKQIIVVRKDWDNGMVFEVAIGLDRLVNLLLSKE